MEPARRVGPLRGRGWIVLLANLPGVKVRKHLVTEIFQDERLASVAHDEPVALVDPHLVHCTAPNHLCAYSSNSAKDGHHCKIRHEGALTNCAGSTRVAMIEELGPASD